MRWCEPPGTICFLHCPGRDDWDPYGPSYCPMCQRGFYGRAQCSEWPSQCATYWIYWGWLKSWWEGHVGCWGEKIADPFGTPWGTVQVGVTQGHARQSCVFVSITVAGRPALVGQGLLHFYMHCFKNKYYQTTEHYITGISIISCEYIVVVYISTIPLSAYVPFIRLEL